MLALLAYWTNDPAGPPALGGETTNWWLTILPFVLPAIGAALTVLDDWRAKRKRK